MIINSQFKPARFLKNTHLQSMLPTFLVKRKPSLKTIRERISLPDGDFMDVEWYGKENKGPIIILVHGITGNINAPYIKSLMPVLAAQGYRTVMMYYRGYSGEHNRSNAVTHAGKTDDFSILIATLKQWEPDTPLAAIGFSQGANMLLKYLGEHDNNTQLTCAIAISPPFQLRVIANEIRQGLSKVYQWYLLRNLRAFYRAKFAYRQAPFNLNLLDQCRSFWQFDDEITAKVSGFKNAIDYYRQASCINYLKGITIPTLIIHSKDDSIMTPEVIPYSEQLSDSTVLELSEYGGHLGFVSGSIFKPKFWLNERIPVYLQHYLPMERLPIKDLPIEDLPIAASLVAHLSIEAAHEK